MPETGGCVDIQSRTAAARSLEFTVGRRRLASALDKVPDNPGAHRFAAGDLQQAVDHRVERSIALPGTVTSGGGDLMYMPPSWSRKAQKLPAQE